MACSSGTFNCYSSTFFKQFSTRCLAARPTLYHPGRPLHDVRVEIRRDLRCGQLVRTPRGDDFLVRSDDMFVGIRGLAQPDADRPAR
eukprot:10461594-Heterocapsa_arctica.AAC.1